MFDGTDESDGNLYDATLYKIKKFDSSSNDGWITTGSILKTMDCVVKDKAEIPSMLHYKASAFELGEILIIDETEREVNVGCRKPDKWDVEYEIFDSVSEAVKRSDRIHKQEVENDLAKMLQHRERAE